MRFILLLACFGLVSVTFASAEVTIQRSAQGWDLTNGQIEMELTRSDGGVQLKSLRRVNGGEWASAGASIVDFPEKASARYRFASDDIAALAKGARQLTLRFQSESGVQLTLELRMYPSCAVIEMAARMENRGRNVLSLKSWLDPLSFTLRNPAGDLKPFSSVQGENGFQPVGSLGARRDFGDWLVLENQSNGESALIGGEPGLGILHWNADVRVSSSTAVVSAGTLLLKNKPGDPLPTFELSPGEAVETPITFLALAKGDSDNVANETFHYLKRYIFLAPAPNAPLVAYCIWLTQKDSEAPILRELQFAKSVGFDVFYHDATWMEGSSVTPGMNDWTKGLGSYKENRIKFPQGLEAISNEDRAAGMMFGLWVDPGNVDAARVESGEIPSKWEAEIDGKPLGGSHPSLALSRQLCLGDPEVVAWIEKELSETIATWHLGWMKWDPSATVNYECNRTDHGHGRTDGAYAAYRGRLEIYRYLLARYPDLSGFEVDPSLQYSRTNPGPASLLPGGYINEFITGPMLAPNVWGSLSTEATAGAGGDHLAGRWYSASALDYNLRKHFTHGVTFGNVGGMSSQLLSNAPPGYIEAFERNLQNFKLYRRLLLDDMYHPKMEAAGWSSVQYVKEDRSESVLFIFRDHSNIADTRVRMRGLDPEASYLMRSLNDRPGRERIAAGAVLMKDGISEHLPNEWLANGDGGLAKQFPEQQLYGSDIWMLKRLP